MRRKVGAFMLVLIMILSLFSEPAYAVDSSHKQSSQIERIEELAKVCTPTSSISTEDMQNFGEFWLYLKDLNLLSLDESGHLLLSDNLAIPDMYKDYLDMIDFINRLVDVKLLEISEAFDLKGLDITEESLALISQESDDCLPPITPYYEPHDCQYPRLNVSYLCMQNYNTLSDFYDNMLLVASLYPDINPYISTVSFWIGKVGENCAWDYKTQPGYSPYSKVFCMSYGDYDYMHQTSEWLGNYNYGFTGSFLFSLDILHWGSSIASGLDPADEEDWPAIDEGYNDAP